MGVYKYDAINDELIPIAGVPSVPGIEDKVSTYTADATYWDTSPTSASNKPVTSGGVYTALANKADVSALSDKLGTYASSPSAWDTTPTAASTKPVISDGIKTQFDKANNELADVNNILGSKNILPNKATTQVINGVTFTVSADGSINVNGTATADAILHFIPNTTGKLSAFFSKGGNYIISTGTTGAGPNVFFGIEYTGSTWDIGEWLTYSTQTSKEIYIDGSKLNNSSSVIECYVKVNSGTTVSNKKVYPMLRPSNIKDDTYVPYSKTNYELTTEISNCTNLINELSTLETKSGSGSYYSQYRLTKVGKVVFVYIYNIIASTLSQDIVIMTLPAGYRPVQNMVVCGPTQNGQLQASNNAQFYSIGTDGKIKSYTYFAINGGQLLATFITS